MTCDVTLPGSRIRSCHPYLCLKGLSSSRGEFKVQPLPQTGVPEEALMMKLAKAGPWKEGWDFFDIFGNHESLFADICGVLGDLAVRSCCLDDQVQLLVRCEVSGTGKLT